MSENRSPLKAIKAKCLDCCCGQQNEVKLCPSEKCPLHPFRLGKNPYTQKREYTEEQRNAFRVRFTENVLGKKNAVSSSCNPTTDTAEAENLE